MRRYRAALAGILIFCLSVALVCGMGRAEYAPWDCPDCGRTGITRNYCGGCSHPAPWMKEAFGIVGNIVRYGHYEQDNNLDNGQEEIEWIVLDVQEGKSLLISKYGLDAKPYNTSCTAVTWETCTLRAWLNNDFLKMAFTAEEQFSILITMVDNSEGQGYSIYNAEDTDGGNNTLDQIFLLSYHEAFDLYFESNNARMCAPTDYAKSHGADTISGYEVDGRSAGWWWLRSPGSYQVHATSVYLIGSYGSNLVDDADDYVRPAFWINLESDIF